MFPRVAPNLKISAHDMQEFFAIMRVGFAAAASRFDAEKMRLHRRVSPGQQLHAHFRRGFQDFSLVRAHQARIISGGFEERKNVGAVEAGDAAQRGNRGAHLAALESAEKADGDSSGPSHVGQRKAAAGTQAAEPLPGGERTFCWGRDDSLALEHVGDGGGVEVAGPAKENSALHQPRVRFGKKEGWALRTLRRNEAQSFPGAQRRRGNTPAAGHLPDWPAPPRPAPPPTLWLNFSSF